MFEKHSFWDNKDIAYYQGSNMIYYLSCFKGEYDRNLYMRLTNKVAESLK